MRLFLISVLVIIVIIVFSAFTFHGNFYFLNEKLLTQWGIGFLPPLPKITEMKGIYITVNTAFSSHVDKIIELIKSSELNSLVIDIKTDRETYLDNNMKTLVRRLRFADIFPVARLPVFQHNGLALAHPELAIKNSDGSLWRDSGGRFWLDPASTEVWKIILEEAKRAAKIGFGEINLDYIRFPSDGHLESTIYPVWNKKTSREKVISDFTRFMKENLKKEFPDIQLTGDIFGYLLLRDDDLGIGQSITELSKIFDYLCPMVYPSHYDAGNFNFSNPADHPYEVIKQSLDSGKKIFEKHKQEFKNIRPWIQDFNLGAIYTTEMIRQEMKAITDSGLTSGWLIWNPNNRYRPEIFLSK